MPDLPRPDGFPSSRDLQVDPGGSHVPMPTFGTATPPPPPGWEPASPVAQPGEQLTWRHADGWWALATWLVVFTVVSTMMLIVGFVTTPAGDELAAPVLLAMVLVGQSVAALAVAGLVIVRGRGRLLRDSLALVSPAKASVALLWGLVGFVGVTALFYLFELTGTLPEHEDELLGAVEGPGSILLLFVAVAVVAPISEELTFRGVLLPALTARWSAGVGIVASSVLFALVHATPLPQMAGLFALGLLFGVLLARSERLLTPMLAHAGYNTAVVTTFLFL